MMPAEYYPDGKIRYHAVNLAVELFRQAEGDLERISAQTLETAKQFYAFLKEPSHD